MFAQVNSSGSGGSPNEVDGGGLLLPFGEWLDQIVDGIDRNYRSGLSSILGIFELLVGGITDFLTETRWYLVCVFVFVIALLVRNARVGLSCVGALILTSYLGTNYWFIAMRTFGALISIMLLTSLIGIPLGHALGRLAPRNIYVLKIVRASLGAHLFFWMLPIIFFFSFGITPGVIVALCVTVPVMALTVERGVRQGENASWQLHGKPSVVVGLGQTLLVGSYALGVAAIMGAGGFALESFRALSTLDTSLAGQSGLAFGLVIYVVYQLTQPKQSDGGLIPQIGERWGHRPSSSIASEAARRNASEAKLPRLSRSDVPIAVLALLSALVTAWSVSLAWGSDVGRISAWGNQAHEDGSDFADLSTDGLANAGGSGFGVLLLLGAAMVFLACVRQVVWPWARESTSAVTAVGAGLSFGSSVGFLLANPSGFAADSVVARGPWIGLFGSIGMVLAALWWHVSEAGYQAVPGSRPDPAVRRLGLTLAIAACVAVLFGSMYAHWSVDKRGRTIISAELQAELDQVLEDVSSGKLSESLAAQTIQQLNNSAIRSDLTIIDGRSDDGAGLGRVSFAIGVVALVAVIGAQVAKSRRLKILAYLFAVASAAASAAVSSGWILSLMNSDRRFYSGFGSALAVCAALLIMAMVIREILSLKEQSDGGGRVAVLDGQQVLLTKP